LSWVDELVSMVFKSRDREFYIVASGLTTSGPAHMGTIMELLIPYTISKAIRLHGRKAHFIFVADTMDSLDSIPAQLSNFKELKDFIGRPLCMVMDPYGCHSSYGYHFLDEIVDMTKKLNIEFDEILTADVLYREGWYDDYARLYYSVLNDVKEVLERTSLRKLPNDWKGVVKPICGKCRRNDLTTVLAFEDDTIKYRCEFCGYEGAMNIESHEWKLLWRLDWPSRQDFLGVDIEGGGVDHFTKGGSWDTAQAVHKLIFNKEPPIGFKFGFVLIEGKKMSKSKGIGALSEIMRILHPAVIKYFLLKHDLEENRNLRLDPKYILSLYDEYKSVGDGRYQNLKQLKAWEFSGGIKWRTSFSELLVYYQIYRDWGLIKELIKDEETVDDLVPYIEELIRAGMIPEDYDIQLKPTPPPPNMRELISEFANLITEFMSDVEIHNTVYEVARRRGVDPSELFKSIYITLLGKPRGPRLGKFIKILGVRRFKEIVNDVLSKI